MGLSKNSVTYLATRDETNQLHDPKFGNRVKLALSTGINVVTDETAPEVRSTGNTICYLTGKLTVTSGAITDMPLLEFPSDKLPHNVGQVVAVKETSAGAKSLVSLSVTSDKLLLNGVAPTVGDIIHLDGILYISRL